MTYDFRYSADNMTNFAELSINPFLKDGEDMNRISFVSNRFQKTALLLPPSSFLGWQVSAEKDKNVSCFAFSSLGLNVSEEDYNWIFKDCANVRIKSQARTSYSNSIDANSKVYALVSSHVALLQIQSQ